MHLSVFTPRTAIPFFCSSNVRNRVLWFHICAYIKRTLTHNVVCFLLMAVLFQHSSLNKPIHIKCIIAFVCARSQDGELNKACDEAHVPEEQPPSPDEGVTVPSCPLSPAKMMFVYPLKDCVVTWHFFLLLLWWWYCAIICVCTKGQYSHLTRLCIFEGLSRHLCLFLLYLY